MIKNFTQAFLVQSTRACEGKRGIARAVRRFMKRSSGDWYGYNELKQRLPANPIIPEPKEVIINGTI